MNIGDRVTYAARNKQYEGTVKAQEKVTMWRVEWDDPPGFDALYQEYQLEKLLSPAEQLIQEYLEWFSLGGTSGSITAIRKNMRKLVGQDGD